MPTNAKMKTLHIGQMAAHGETNLCRLGEHGSYLMNEGQNRETQKALGRLAPQFWDNSNMVRAMPMPKGEDSMFYGDDGKPIVRNWLQMAIDDRAMLLKNLEANKLSAKSEQRHYAEVAEFAASQVYGPKNKIDTLILTCNRRLGSNATHISNYLAAVISWLVEQGAGQPDLASQVAKSVSCWDQVNLMLPVEVATYADAEDILAVQWTENNFKKLGTVETSEKSDLLTCKILFEGILRDPRGRKPQAEIRKFLKPTRGVAVYSALFLDRTFPKAGIFAKMTAVDAKGNPLLRPTEIGTQDWQRLTQSVSWDDIEVYNKGPVGKDNPVTELLTEERMTEIINDPKGELGVKPRAMSLSDAATRVTGDQFLTGLVSAIKKNDPVAFDILKKKSAGTNLLVSLNEMNYQRTLAFMNDLRQGELKHVEVDATAEAEAKPAEVTA